MFGPGFGQHRIYGFATEAGSDDRILLFGLGFMSFADVQARTTTVSGSAVIRVDLNITLVGVSPASLSAHDFLLA